MPQSDLGWAIPFDAVADPLVAAVTDVVLGFLIGSIPFGFLVGKFVFKSDIRQSGSGNIGAANALRSYGKLGGALVLLLDVAKGIAPFFAVVLVAALTWRTADPFAPQNAFSTLGRNLMMATMLLVPDAADRLAQLSSDDHLLRVVPYLTGFATVLGHCFSPWLRFRGGKGVATYLGVTIVFAWPAALAFALVWIAIVARTRFASLASLVATIVSGAITTAMTGGIGAAFAVPAAVLIFYKHRDNITRLREGRENTLSFGRAAPLKDAPLASGDVTGTADSGG